VGSADCQSAIQQVDNLRHKAKKFGQHARNEVAQMESFVVGMVLQLSDAGVRCRKKPVKGLLTWGGGLIRSRLFSVDWK
jgi:hypothetical protein